MPLQRYLKKRDFKETPEPSGVNNNDKTDGALKFCVQKHAASHLHYDFRLELDGVLKSWAVPKGPSLNPKDKRLAMMVEDHPLDYLTFEGKIPAGNYGAGDVIVWDIGTYQGPYKTRSENEKYLRNGLKKGHIDINLKGKKLQGLFSLIKIRSSKFSRKDNTWLLIKKDDKDSSEIDLTRESRSALSKKTLDSSEKSDIRLILKKAAKSPPPQNTKPMLATLIDKPFDDPNWLFEIKWDGYRCIAEIDKKKKAVKLFSRHGLSFNEYYPEIVKALNDIEHTAVLDGEVIAFDKDNRPSFQMLQNWGRRGAKLAYALFDILYLDGLDLTGLPLKDRKEILKSIIPQSPYLIYSEHVIGKGKELFLQAEKQNFEGIIGKLADSRYEIGRRSHMWIKIKTQKRQEAVIGGMTRPRGSRKLIGALILGVYENEKLKYIGHTGSGFDEESLNKIYKKLKPLVTRECPFETRPKTNAQPTWVKPKLVCEVKFEEWTSEGHMRQPIFLGLREDKPARSVVAEKEKNVQTVQEKAEAEKDPNSELKLSHLDKVFWPKEGYTKGDVLNYYEKISEILLPHLKDRPESLNRHPDGIEAPNFFQKNFAQGVPSFAESIKVKSGSENRTVNYIICNNKESLLYIINLGCIELNPWISRLGSLDRPDFMVIDLDPGGNTFNDLIKVAKTIKKILDKACVESFIKTSGKRGIHIYVPMGAKYSYEEVRLFCEIIVNKAHMELPELTSLERSPAKRKNKIYLDYLQNREGQTVAAPYSLRPYPGATVSTPLKWTEVKRGLTPKKFTIKSIFKRIAKYGDLWKDIMEKPADLEKALKCLNRKKGF